MDRISAALSRRHLLGYGAASLAFADTAFGQSAKDKGFEPLPTEIKVSPKQLTIDVRVNNKGPFRFVVDTGADRSVIAEELAQALHLPLGREMTVQGIVRSLQAKSVPVASLQFGSVVRDNLEMPVLPRKMLQADGYLGLDALGHDRVVFDFKHRTMQVASPRSVWYVEKAGRANETRIEATGFAGHLRSAACFVDGVNTTVFIDTGAEVSVCNGPLQRALLERSQAYAGTRDVSLTGVTGGTSVGRVIKVETILFGNLEFTGCELAVADLDVFKIWDLTDKPAMLIGLNFRRQFSLVSVDYGRHEYRLYLTSSGGWVNHKRA